MTRAQQPAITIEGHSDEERDTSSIQGRLDQPSVAEGALVLPGWVFGRESAAVAVEVRDESAPAIRTSVGRPRPDVFERVPGAPENAGFLFSVVPSRGSGASRLRLDAVLEDGNRARLGWIEVTVRPSASAGRALHGQSEEGIEWRLADRSDARPLTGKDGWLFLGDDPTDVIGQHTGKVKLGRRGRRKWKRVLASRVAAAEALGVFWQSLVAPDKEAVYAEFLPDSVRLAPRRPVDEFLEVSAAVGANVAYPLEALREARSEMLVYRQADTHWTDFGAYIAYRILCEALEARGLGVPVLARDRLAWRRVPVVDHLGGKLDLGHPGHTVGAVIKAPSARVAFDNRILTHGSVVVFESERPGPTCVTFGESFGAILVPFLAETFRRLVFVHTSMWIREVVEIERPEVVLSLPLERFLVELPADGGLEALRNTIDAKRMNGRFKEGPFLHGLAKSPAVEDGSQKGRLPPEWLPDPGAEEPPRAPLPSPTPARAETEHMQPPRAAPETGTVSIRTATFEDLRSLGMSVTQARRILRYRESGELASAADLVKVPGFPRQLRDELERRMID